jgi:hypothetical protein
MHTPNKLKPPKVLAEEDEYPLRKREARFNHR